MTIHSINLDVEPEQLARDLENLAKQIRIKLGQSNLQKNRDLAKVYAVLNGTEFLDKAKKTALDLQEVKNIEVKVSGTADVEIGAIDLYELEQGELYDVQSVDVYDYNYDDNEVIACEEVKKIVEDRAKKAEELMADVRKFAEDNELELGLVWQVILER